MSSSGAKVGIVAAGVGALDVGSVLFADSSGQISEDNASFSFNDTTNVLSVVGATFSSDVVIGTALDTGVRLQVSGAASEITALFKANATTPGNIIEARKSDDSIAFRVRGDVAQAFVGANDDIQLDSVNGRVTIAKDTASFRMGSSADIILSRLGASQWGAAARFYPGTPALATQTAAALYGGTGAPNNADGNNGDLYVRSDGGALSTLYQRRAGAWVGIL
jgi:hypothetical protein